MNLKGVIKSNATAALELQQRITDHIQAVHSDKFPGGEHFVDFMTGEDGRCFFVLPNNRHRGFYAAAFNPGELKPDIIERSDSNWFFTPEV